MMCDSHLSLDHRAALSPELQDALVDIDTGLGLQHLQHDVQHDERPRPPYPGAAVNNQGRWIRGEVGLADVPNEPQQGRGVARDSVVRPSLEIVVDQFPLLLSLYRNLVWMYIYTHATLQPVIYTVSYIELYFDA